MKSINKNIIEGFRFSEDLKNFNILKKDRKLTKLASQLIKEYSHTSSEQSFMRSGFKVSKELSPRYHKLFREAEKCLAFDSDQIITYINPDFHVNAACIKEEDNKYLIYLTSSLIEKMSDQEILFVIGHELGHAFYNHHALPVRGIMNSFDPPKANKALHLLKWSRMAEISADRAGLLCCRDLDAALGAMLVLTSGIPSSLLNVDSEAYGKHSEELIPNLLDSQTIDDLYATHPFNPLRVMSLKLFWESKELYDLLKIGENKKDLSQISLEIRQIFNSMDGDESHDETLKKQKKNGSKKPIKKNNQSISAKTTKDLFLNQEEECLFWGCILVASVSDDISESEIESILSINKNDEISIELNRLKLVKDIKKLAAEKFKMSLVDIENLKQQKRCSMLQKLILVARSDGNIDEKEKKLLESMCIGLKIPNDFYKKILEYL